MRGCPWQCRFCQSTVIKRPLRVRSVVTIVQSALEAYRNTGYEEISLLSLSTSDYPDFFELVKKMRETFEPLGVSVSLPSLRVNSHFPQLPALMKGIRKSGMTLAPEVARDDMRTQIRKPIRNEDLYEGCRKRSRTAGKRVKLYFMCGLPGERVVDLDGIVDMAETIAHIGRESAAVRRGDGVGVELRAAAHAVSVERHADARVLAVGRPVHEGPLSHPLGASSSTTSSAALLEGILTRGDRRAAPALEEAWRRGCRLDGWTECLKPNVWWKTFEDLGIDPAFYSQRTRPMTEVLPWDHVNVKKGREYLEKEQQRSLVQLSVMANAT
jgi:hypothetical protein